MYFQVTQAYRYPIELYETRISCCGLEVLSADPPLDSGHHFISVFFFTMGFQMDSELNLPRS
jgi:hypothetical protein